MKHGDEKYFLHPGEYAFAKSGVHLHTLLGSCISITLWHPQKTIGGMCHFALPGHPRNGSDKDKPDGRYAEGAMELFKRSVAKNGTLLRDYQAKIFGGGNMLKKEGDNVEDTIGAKNAVAGMQLLMDAGVDIRVAHVGEFGHRRIVFDISTGEVWVKHQPAEGMSSLSLSGRI